MDTFITKLPTDSIVHVIDRLPSTVLILLLGYVIIRIIQWSLVFILRTSRVTKAMQQIMMQAVSAILWVGLAALMLQSLGLNQLAIALSGSIAIIGIGIASGANKLVSDVVAGLFLAKNRDFKIGETIELAEAKGRIHSLDARKVRILGEDGTLFVVPNTKFDEQLWKILPDKQKEK